MPRIAADIPEETREKLDHLAEKTPFTISDFTRFALEDFLPSFESGEVTIINNVPVRTKVRPRPQAGGEGED